MDLSRRVGCGLVILFLVFPFLFLLTHFHQLRSLDWDEFFWAFGNSFWQALGSATLSLVLGLWGAAGLLKLSSANRGHWRSLLEIFLLAPNFLPALFTLLSALTIVDPFPMGLPGMILVHVCLNWGLVAVLVAGIIESKMGGIAEQCWVEGCSRWRFLWRGIFPMLWKDLGLLWLFVFAVCFGSFAIPLVVGGGRGTTLEVLIYEKIRLSTDWGQAVFIALLQSIFLFVFSFAIRGRAAAVTRRANLQLFQSISGIVVIVAFSAFLILGYGQGLWQGLLQGSSLWEIRADVFWGLMGSLGMGLMTGALCFGFLLVLAMLWPSAWFQKFFTGYVAPSQALTSFAFLILTPNEGFWPFVKIPLALTLMTVPVLWRMGWESQLDSLRGQHQVAESLGASPGLIFRDIVQPQVAARAGVLAGLAAVWASGDFAVSRILAHRDLTIGMMTETLMSGYRLGLATVLSLGIVLVGLICFAAMMGVGRVLSRKPIS